MTTILIVDDHPLFRTALRSTLGRELPSARLAEAEDVASLEALLARERTADLVLLDLHMPGAEGLSALTSLRASHPALPVLVVSAREEPGVVAAVRAAGAAGFVPKSAEIGRLGEAVRAVLAGGRWFPAGAGETPARLDATLPARLVGLTPQQRRVLELLGQGLFNKQIADALGIAEATVKAHMTAILRKLGVSNRTRAVLLARRLLGPSGED